MWLWDHNSIDCVRKVAFASGVMQGMACDTPAKGYQSPGESELDNMLEYYHYTNATLLELNGFLEDAIHEYREVIKINPLEGFYRYNLGVALLKNDQYNEAYKELTEAIHLCPDDYEARYALADVHCAIGRNLELEGRLAEALESYEESITIDSQYPDYHLCKGRVLLEGARNQQQATGIVDTRALGEAEGALRAALAIDPQCDEAKLNLGMVLILGGSINCLDEGITALNDALKIDPLNDEARYCLDRALKMRNFLVECG